VCFYLVELSPRNQVRPVLVDQSAEGQTIAEAVAEVLNFNVLVAFSLPLAPKQQSFLGGQFCVALLSVSKFLLTKRKKENLPSKEMPAITNFWIRVQTKPSTSLAFLSTISIKVKWM